MAYDYEKERREAIETGERALRSLRRAKSELDSAKNWGILDLLGGGFITDLVKHSKMNHAQDYMEEAKCDLQAFGKELRDVSGYIDSDFNSMDFLSFADYFFDGLVADWLMQSRIKDAKRQVDEAITKVERVLREL